MAGRDATDSTLREKARAALPEGREELDRLACAGILTAWTLHEVRNAAVVISGAIDLAERNAAVGNPGVREAIGEAKEAADLLLGFLGDHESVFHPDRAETGPMDIAEPVEAAVRILNRRVQQCGRLVFDDPLSARIEGSAQQLTHVFVNLILNACDALEQDDGGDEIRIRVTRQGAWVVVDVEDDGPGISEERLDKIFEAFYSTKANGTGLGLAICREIVRGHGGELVAAAAPDGGARMTVRLPLRA